MNFTRNAFAHALTALALAGTASAALANNPSRDLLAANSAAARMDVRTACAGLDQHLQQSLSQLRGRTGLREDVTVRFVLDGNEVRDVEVAGAVSMDARNAVRRAMRQLNCSDSAARQAPQAFSFVLGVEERSAPAPALDALPSTQVGLAQR
jgi:hypothetical protein